MTYENTSSRKQTALTTTKHGDLARARAEIVEMVLNSLSPGSRRVYRKALDDFFGWHEAQGRPPLSKRAVQGYKRHLEDRGLSPSTINRSLCAIRKLAREAADNALLDPVLAEGIGRVKGVRSEGVRTGNWLTRNQAQALLDAPDASTLKGLRDRALLAVLIGTGLRRTETASLTFAHVQQREGRWAIVDIVGKRGKVRTVPMPSWAKAAIDEWAEAVGIYEGCVFRAMAKGDRVNGAQMTPQAIRDVVNEYASSLGFDGIAPHDLRRTFAKLAHKGGSGLDQIQLSLGHASIKTTERYLGIEQDLTDAPCDRLGLRI
jgi:site-specific recombinase XerD